MSTRKKRIVRKIATAAELKHFAVEYRKNHQISQEVVAAKLGTKQAAVSTFELKRAPENLRCDEISQYLSAMGLELVFAVLEKNPEISQE